MHRQIRLLIKFPARTLRNNSPLIDAVIQFHGLSRFADAIARHWRCNFGGSLNGNAFNIFLPWMINLDGTGAEIKPTALRNVGADVNGITETVLVQSVKSIDQIPGNRLFMRVQISKP